MQAVLLLLAMTLGLVLGIVLLAADRSSWAGARTTTATVTGVSSKGVLADAGGKQVVIHLAPLPSPGTLLQVQVSPDGRARPTSFAQTPAKAIRDGVGLALLLTVLLQAYRFVVTRRGPE